MDWIAHYRERRRRYWPAVEGFFGQLPPDLYRQGTLLRHDLATAYSDSGQFEDLLSRASDYPLLDFAFWLLDDWGTPEAETRAQLEQQLFTALVLIFGATYVRESILDQDTNFDVRFQSLEQALAQGTLETLTQLFPRGTPFWNYYDSFASEYDKALLQSHNGFGTNVSDDDALRWVGHRLAFTKITAAAVALQLGPPYVARLPELLGILDDLNLATQICQDVATLRRDLWRGRRTYPIVRTRHAVGIAPDQAVAPEQVLGAAVLTGSISRILAENIQRLEASRVQADALGLPTFNHYMAAVIDRLQQLSQLFSLKTQTNAPFRPTRIFAPASDTSSLTLAIEMAERYLLSDLTWRESWEVQRQGMLGVPELIGRAFAPGLVVEVLCQHRSDMSEQVEAILQVMADNGFRYFPHPRVPPDADDLGLALRLSAYAGQRERQRPRLQLPLTWMEANINPAGQIACWFTRGVEGWSEEGVLLWGNTCLTVEANLLRGLLAYDREPFRPLIERSATQWLERWVRSGLGANNLYIPHYALWTAVELLAQLSAWPGRAFEPYRMPEAYARCRQHWQTQIEHVHLPQEAAFLTLMSLRAPESAGMSEGFDPNWIQLMLKNQRYDGSWAGEPLYVTPTRGEVATWYSSHSVTTAYIWHALKTYAGWRAGGPVKSV